MHYYQALRIGLRNRMGWPMSVLAVDGRKPDGWKEVERCFAPPHCLPLAPKCKDSANKRNGAATLLQQCFQQRQFSRLALYPNLQQIQVKNSESNLRVLCNLPKSFNLPYSSALNIVSLYIFILSLHVYLSQSENNNVRCFEKFRKH